MTVSPRGGSPQARLGRSFADLFTPAELGAGTPGNTGGGYPWSAARAAAPLAAPLRTAYRPAPSLSHAPAPPITPEHPHYPFRSTLSFGATLSF